MFKSLLRTLPSLSGNFTIACRLNEIKKDDSDNYHTYIRVADLLPLQNNIYKDNIELNLLNGKYEHDIKKYFSKYSNFFYKENYTFNKKNYKILNLDSLYNENNDNRNKDYEFGCKRIYYSRTGYQFSFYAPFYLDSINDLPEYFCIHIKIGEIVKNIKIYLNKDNKVNYLKRYLISYINQIDNRVIFCLPESLQATYFGIDVKKGGLVQYKDNMVGYLYTNQIMINNFDNIICKGFERNNIIMRQIIPVSFMFNINDIFNEYEQDYFKGYDMNIYGYYYTSNDIKYDFFDFDIDYFNSYNKYKKYNKQLGKYEYANGKDNNGLINIMNVGYPSLNESKYIKYEFTNKITPSYCKFKLMFSSDNDPYIINTSFGYSYLQYPNQKYGYFPTTLKGINPSLICINNDVKMPIGLNIETYYNTSKYFANKVITNDVNYKKYLKLMQNYVSEWFNIYNNETLEQLCNNSKYWSDVILGYSYFNGILYNLKNVEKYNINKFGVLLNCNLNIISENELEQSKYVYSYSDASSNISYKFNNNYNLKHYDSLLDVIYYNNFFVNNVIINSKNNQSYLHYNKLLKKDFYGKYIKVNDYKNSNTYLRLSDAINLINEMTFPSEIKNYIISLFNINKVLGYIILDGENNLNYFEKYYDEYKNEFKRFMLTTSLFKTNNKNIKYEWLYNKLYYSSQINSKKIKLSSVYDKIDWDESVGGKFVIYLEDYFIYSYDLYNIISNIYKNDDYLNIIDLNINENILRKYFTEYDSYYELKELRNKILLYDETNNIEVLHELQFENFEEAKNIINDKISIELNGKTENEFFSYYKELYKKSFFDLNILINNKYDKYIFESFGIINNITIENYFVNENNIKTTKSIYVDTYNLNNLIDIFNIKTNSNISLNNAEKKNYFIKIINKDHIIEYYFKLNKDENYISTLEFDENNNYVNKNILECLYVKERKWVIDNNVIKTIDAYTTLYNFILKYLVTYEYSSTTEYNNIEYDENTKYNMSLLYNLIKDNINDNDVIYNWLINNLSDTRNLNNKFELKIGTLSIELDLCIRKEVVKLNKDLFNILYYDGKLNNFLYLYIEDNCKKENSDIWDVYDYNYISNYNLNCDTYYDWESKKIDKKLYSKDINEYLIPLFTDVYVNELNIDTIFNMIQYKKINSNYEYIVNIESYFKEIDVYETLCDIYSSKLYIINDLFDSIHDINKPESNSLIEDKIYYLLCNHYQKIKNLIRINFKNLSNIYYASSNEFINALYSFDNLSQQNSEKLINAIIYITENTEKFNELKNYLESKNILDEFNNEYKFKYLEKFPNINFEIADNIVQAELQFLKDLYNEYFYQLINDNNIILYSLQDNLSIRLNKFNDENVIYDEKNKLYIYKYNGLTYAFHFIDININNSNFSFNILNDYNLNVVFNSINGYDINNDLINMTFKNLYPFLKINIFEEFAKLVNTIIFQNELEIIIKYVAYNYLSSDEQKKYQNYITSENDKLYGTLAQLNKDKKIKILRYFNFITPLLKKVNSIIDNVWSLKFMDNNAEYNDIEKYNILNISSINIYKYDPLTVYNGEYKKWDEILNLYYQFTDSRKVNQIEYKHFNDNLVYNLPEQIILYDNKTYTLNELDSIKDDEEFLNNKKINILYKYLYGNSLDHTDIKLFLFNKYKSSFFIEKDNVKYKIKYVFTLI